MSEPLIPLGHERIVTPFTSTSPTNLTLPALNQGGTYAARYVRLTLIQTELANLRWRDDGTDPTSTQGMLIASSQSLPFEYYGDPQKLRIVTTSTGAVANIAYYG